MILNDFIDRFLIHYVGLALAQSSSDTAEMDYVMLDYMLSSLLAVILLCDEFECRAGMVDFCKER